MTRTLRIPNEPRFVRALALAVDPGDTLVLFTDGILEATNEDGDIFGEDGLIEFIRTNIDKPAFEIIRGLCKEIRFFAGSARLQDDTTAVIIRRQ